MRTPTIKEACKDDKLFRLDLWLRQAAVLIAIAACRLSVLALGRRSGKSLLAAAWAAYDALFRDLTAYLRPGEHRYILCVAASQEQARIVLGFARDLIANSPLLAACIVGETADSITVRQPATGALVTIRTIPCSARTGGRGLAVSTVIFDELAHWITDTEGPAVAERVYRSLVPATAQFGDEGRVIAISTPYGNDNHFARLFEQAEADPDAYALQAATWEINTTIDRAFFDAERERDPEAFATEYAAEFREGGGAFIPWTEIEAAVGREDELPPGLDLISPVAALDPGFSRDPFALAIVGRHPEQRNRLRLAVVRTWRPRKGSELEVEDLLDEVAAICRRYRVGKVWTDQYASVPVRQALARRGVAARELTMTATSKTAIYSTLKAKLAASDLELYAHPELLAELGRIEVRYSAGSAGVRIPRRGGSHGDLAQALALAVHALRAPGGRRAGRIRSGGYDPEPPVIRLQGG
jgi:hypothetical protein